MICTQNEFKIISDDGWMYYVMDIEDGTQIEIGYREKIDGVMKNVGEPHRIDIECLPQLKDAIQYFIDNKRTNY